MTLWSFCDIYDLVYDIPLVFIYIQYFWGETCIMFVSHWPCTFMNHLPSIENCSFTLQRGGEFMPEASRNTDVPSE